MNNANLKTSKRLQRLHKLLSDGEEHSGIEITYAAHIQAVSAAVSELRACGFTIVNRQTRKHVNGDIVGRSFYRMMAA